MRHHHGRHHKGTKKPSSRSSSIAFVARDFREKARRIFRQVAESIRTGCNCERSTYIYRAIYCPMHHDDPRKREPVPAVSIE